MLNSCAWSCPRVRKGAWSEEEDNLLRKRIHKYGPEKWHLVPFRAGLNRCRKSCRLRWLNYLRPDIKRGSFSFDEADLIVRLHKLLGNRWSLIAGRIPGRTANDVKNYWNTHLQKKVVAMASTSNNSSNNWKGKVPVITAENTVVVRPRPRRLLKTSSSPTSTLTGKATAVVAYDADPTKLPPHLLKGNIVQQNNAITTTLPSETTSPSHDSRVQWWEDLLLSDKELNGQGTTCGMPHQGQTDWTTDFPIDMDILERLN